MGETSNKGAEDSKRNAEIGGFPFSVKFFHFFRLGASDYSPIIRLFFIKHCTYTHIKSLGCRETCHKRRKRLFTRTVLVLSLFLLLTFFSLLLILVHTYIDRLLLLVIDIFFFSLTVNSERVKQYYDIPTTFGLR